MRGLTILIFGVVILFFLMPISTQETEILDGLCPKKYRWCDITVKTWKHVKEKWNIVFSYWTGREALPDKSQILKSFGQIDPESKDKTRKYSKNFLLLIFFCGFLFCLIGFFSSFRAGIRAIYKFNEGEKKYSKGSEIALRRFFDTSPAGYIPGVIIALLAAACLFATKTSYFNDYFVISAILLGGILLGIFGMIKLLKATSKVLLKPSSRKVSALFNESMSKLLEESLRSLNLVSSEKIANPLRLVTPILSYESDCEIYRKDIIWKVAKDGTVHFGAYNVLFVQFTERHVAAFECDYNFIQDIAYDEHTYEGHYKDIVLVTTMKKSYNSLKTGQKIKWAEVLRLSFPSGEHFDVCAPDQKKLAKITSGARLPKTDAERAVKVIRTMLRDKKD